MKIKVQELIDRGLLEWYQSWTGTEYVRWDQAPQVEVELTDNQACIMGVQFCPKCEKSIVDKFLEEGKLFFAGLHAKELSRLGPIFLRKKG